MICSPRTSNLRLPGGRPSCSTPGRSTAFVCLSIACLASLPVGGMAQTPQVQRDSAMGFYRQGMEAFTAGTPKSLRDAITHWVRGVRFAHEAGDLAGESDLLSHTGDAYRLLGDADSAVAYYERAAGTAHQGGHVGREVKALSSLARAYRDVGDLGPARLAFMRALRASRSGADRLGEAATLNNLGELYRRTGQYDSAVVYLGRGRSRYRPARYSLGRRIRV